jgi:hypothetical protein
MRCYIQGCSEYTGQVCRDCGRPICKQHRMGRAQDNEQGQRFIQSRCVPCTGVYARRLMAVVTSDDGPSAA